MTHQMFNAVWTTLNQWYKYARGREPKRKDTSYTACNSPECVRCSRYQEIRQNAWGKLQEYTQEHGWQGLDRMVLAMGQGPHYQQAMINMEASDNDLHPTTKQQNPNILFLPYLETQSVWNVDKLEEQLRCEVLKLESNYNKILEEFHGVHDAMMNSVDSNIHGWKMNSTEHGSWCVFYLYNQGQKMEENCEKCPYTAGLIDTLPSAMITSLFGNVCFSIIFPGTDIEEHYGPCNVRLRCHLGLEVPESCRLNVADVVEEWREGQVMVFDDSFLHSAHNHSQDKMRGVFMVDMWHPDLSSKEQEALLHVF